MAVTPVGGYFGVLLAIAVAAAVSFGVASVLLGFGRAEQRGRRDRCAAARPSPAPTGA